MRTETVTDVILIGAGIAGLTLALRLPAEMRTTVVTKGALGESNTRYAQGGLAAATGPDDEPDLHFSDTIAAGAGLCDPAAVQELVAGGPAAVRWLLDHGTRFDREGDTLARGREAAHSRNRVLHAGGDATGAEIERALVAKLRARTNVTILEHTTAVDLIVDDDGSCRGIQVLAPGEREAYVLLAAETVLANGGAGQVWAVSSNPPGATGDGIAMALRAGVAVADLEFTQFHPTVLTGPNTDPFLISEAVRGEGAFLRSTHGVRFMPLVHPDAELAPRDVVARAIQQQMLTDDAPVSLDLRHLDPDLVRLRFPTISARLRSFGLDLARDLIPVAPAAHYFMGGIVAGTDGRTSMPGLSAIGEVSCTGVHGANRLASNSLLEGLVFGIRTADRIAAGHASSTSSGRVDEAARSALCPAAIADLGRVRQLMSEHVSVLRSRSGLEAVMESLPSQECMSASTIDLSTPAIEARNVADLAVAITESALHREESRGAHYRADFPHLDHELDGKHQLLQGGHRGHHRSFGSVGDVLATAVNR